MKKFVRTYQDIVTVENLLRAWEEFLRGKRKRVDILIFQIQLMDNIYKLYRDLSDKKYIHGAYRAFNISDPKPRNIHKATVRDRLLHHLLYQELYLYFDKQFIHDSYSCRVRKGTHRAMNRFRIFALRVSRNNTQTCWILKCDIKKFFANIDHGILKKILAKHISDSDILWLLGQVIDSFYAERKGVGLPLGNLTSQLLVNIYMNEFDAFAKHTLKFKYYVRYADDFLALHHNRKYLIELMPKIQNFLEKELKLRLHPQKIFIKTFASGVDFLGWIHFPDHRVLRSATKRRMLKKITDYPTDEIIASYEGLLRHGNSSLLLRKIKELSRSTRVFLL